MPVNPASTSSRVCLGVVSLLIGGVIVFGGYVSLRLRTVYVNNLAIAELRADYDRLKADDEAKLAELLQRSDRTERVLYGDVYAKLSEQAAKQPNRIELWQRNRDKELRDRIQVLERRLLAVERKIE